MRVVAEQPQNGEVPLWRHPEWADEFPWLVQGNTGRGEREDAFDLGLFGVQPVGAVLDRWAQLRRATDMPTAVHARQVHGADLAVHEAPFPPGLVVLHGMDGHATDRAGVLLTVSVADCVPVSVVAARARAVALVHAGWRGTAAGIVRLAVRRLRERYGAEADEIRLHCGPAVCGECYEVGPEVHQAVNPDREPPAGPTPIDLRAAIAEAAVADGVPPAAVTVSAHCTRCGPRGASVSRGGFFSHRAGSVARQMGVLGIRG